MSILKRSVLIASLAAFSLCCATVEPVKLSRKAKVGDTHRFKTEMVLHTAGLEINVDLIASEKVLEVNKDGSYVLEQMQTEQNVSVGGQAQPPQPDVSAKLTYLKTGEIKKIESEFTSPDDIDTASLMSMIWPKDAVDVGSKWEVDTKSSSTVHHKFEILAREKVGKHDTFKIAVEASLPSSDQASAKGINWVEISTGVIIKSNGEMKNVPTAAGVMDEISFTLIIIE